LAKSVNLPKKVNLKKLEMLRGFLFTHLKGVIKFFLYTGSDRVKNKKACKTIMQVLGIEPGLSAQLADFMTTMPLRPMIPNKRVLKI